MLFTLQVSKYCLFALQSSRLYCSAKAKCSICLLVKQADTAFCLCTTVYMYLTSSGGGPRVVHCCLSRQSPGFGSRSRRFERNKNVSSPSTCETQYCGKPPWPRGSVLGLRPPGLEFRILCLEYSVIPFISPSLGGSPGPVQPICAQRWPKARFISFLPHFVTLEIEREKTMESWFHETIAQQTRMYEMSCLTLPLPISHLWENYLSLPDSHLCEIHMCTSMNCNGDISLHAWLKIVNQNGQWHGRYVLLHF